MATYDGHGPRPMIVQFIWQQKCISSNNKASIYTTCLVLSCDLRNGSATLKWPKSWLWNLAMSVEAFDTITVPRLVTAAFLWSLSYPFTGIVCSLLVVSLFVSVFELKKFFCGLWYKLSSEAPSSQLRGRTLMASLPQTSRILFMMFMITARFTQ